LSSLGEKSRIAIKMATTPLSRRTSTHPALSLLQQAHPQSPETATALFQKTIQQRPLHLRPTSPDPNSHNARTQRRLRRLRAAERKARHQKSRSLTAREKRVSGIYDLEPIFTQPTGPSSSNSGSINGSNDKKQAWSIWKGLWKLWIQYVWEVLNLNPSLDSASSNSNNSNSINEYSINLSPVTIGPKLASIDLHGAALQVVRCECVSRVGIWGVVVRETKFALLLVTRGGGVKSTFYLFFLSFSSGPPSLGECIMLTTDRIDTAIPKRGTIFRMEIPLPLSHTRHNPQSKSLIISNESSKATTVGSGTATSQFNQTMTAENPNSNPDFDLDLDKFFSISQQQQSSQSTNTTATDSQPDKASQTPAGNEHEQNTHGMFTDRLILEIHGSQIEARPADRATRKVKVKNLDWL
jgi:ribonuclease P protein subunit POP4